MKNKIILLAFLIFGILFICGQTVLADTAPSGTVSLDNPLSIGTDVPGIIGTVINGVMGVMGAVVLLMVVWGAGAWLTSAGNPEKVKAGSQTMLWAVLGAVITVASYLFLNAVIKLFFTGTG